MGLTPTIIFNPPSSAPNVYITPDKFLPKDDARGKLYSAAHNHAMHTALRTKTASTASPGTPLSAPSHLPPRPSTGLPEAVRKPYDKKYHITQEQVEEIRRLRAKDPVRWTRVRLAEKFECSQFFVGMVAKNETKAEKVREEHQEARERWGSRKRQAREDRERRKGLWGREV